jgi:hypothetical protein
LSVKERQATIHHLIHLRADLTGGKAELFELVDGVKNLSEGEARIFSIYFSSLAGLIPRYSGGANPQILHCDILPKETITC